MKKLISLFAVTTMASTGAMAAVALGGSASVSYDDNGSTGGAVSKNGASTTTYDADITLTGTAGATTVNLGWDVDGSTPSLNIGSMSSTVGPLTIAVDFYNEDNGDLVNDVAMAGMPNGDDDGGVITDSTDDRSVSVSLDAPLGDATVALSDSGDVTLSGTWSGVTVSHTASDDGDSTSAAAAIAGMDITVTNDDGSTTWAIGTTVAGTAVTLNSSKAVTATFGVTGNTVVVTHTAERASSSSTTSTKYSTAQKDAYTTIAVSRDLTSGAALSATYNTFDSSLTLKASVAF